MTKSVRQKLDDHSTSTPDLNTAYVRTQSLCICKSARYQTKHPITRYESDGDDSHLEFRGKLYLKYITLSLCGYPMCISAYSVLRGIVCKLRRLVFGRLPVNRWDFPWQMIGVRTCKDVWCLRRLVWETRSHDWCENNDWCGNWIQ